ncbi:MAG: DUF3179 domain-containing (seleno)protein [Rubripirellula sp.]
MTTPSGKRTLILATLILTCLAVMQFKTRQLISTDSQRFVHHDTTTDAERAQWQAHQQVVQEASQGGQFHQPLKSVLNLPSVDEPELLDIEQAELDDSTEIVGVEVNGESCAFVLDAMSDPTRHIVNLFLNKKPISVSYCSIQDCVRVLSDESDELLPLRVGGLDINNHMVFLFKGKRYSQESRELPAIDYDFVRTSFGAWKLLHPKTVVCRPKPNDFFIH